MSYGDFDAASNGYSDVSADMAWGVLTVHSDGSATLRYRLEGDPEDDVVDYAEEDVSDWSDDDLIDLFAEDLDFSERDRSIVEIERETSQRP